jgi:hypothetical protein
VSSCQDWRSKSKSVFFDFAMIRVGLRETLYLEHIGYIASIDENIGHESIVGIFAGCMFWKEYSVMPA